MRKTESSATLILFGEIAHAVAKGIGITHVVHSTHQAHTHHAALLANSLKGGSQFYLTRLVAFLVSLLNVCLELCKDIRRQNILAKDRIIPEGN